MSDNENSGREVALRALVAEWEKDARDMGNSVGIRCTLRHCATQLASRLNAPKVSDFNAVLAAQTPEVQAAVEARFQELLASLRPVGEAVLVPREPTDKALRAGWECMPTEVERK